MDTTIIPEESLKAAFRLALIELKESSRTHVTIPLIAKKAGIKPNRLLQMSNKRTKPVQDDIDKLEAIYPGFADRFNAALASELDNDTEGSPDSETNIRLDAIEKQLTKILKELSIK